MADSADETDPLALLETATEHERQAQEQQERAQKLCQQAERVLEETVTATLPDDTDVEVAAVTNAEGPYFILTAWWEQGAEAIDDALNESVTLGQPTTFLVGEGAPAEKVASRNARTHGPALKKIIENREDRSGEGALVDDVIHAAQKEGITAPVARRVIQELKENGEVYEPRVDHLRTT